MLLQRFRVNPNAQEMESTYIQRNIDATREAYGLNNVKTEQYQATTEGEEGALADSAESTAQIRLLDPQIVSPTFKQLQQSKQYYTFADTLAVDKYEVDCVSQDTVWSLTQLRLSRPARSSSRAAITVSWLTPSTSYLSTARVSANV